MVKRLYVEIILKHLRSWRDFQSHFILRTCCLRLCIIYKWFRRVRGPAETQTKDVLCIGNPLVVSSYYFSNWFGFFYICIRSCSVRLRAVSLFSWSVEQNSRDTQMTTRVTEGVRALSILNLKKKRNCSQSSVLLAKNVITDLVLYAVRFVFKTMEI